MSYVSQVWHSLYYFVWAIKYMFWAFWVGYDIAQLVICNCKHLIPIITLARVRCSGTYSNITFVLLNCLFLYLIHSKLTRIQDLNDVNYVQIDIYKIELLYCLGLWHRVHVFNFNCILITCNLLFVWTHILTITTA